MPAIPLSIDQLELDLDNPRIVTAADQREAMQRIIEDQDFRLINLADHIVEAGLNPMDNILVIKSTNNPGKYTVLEGNRRLLALKLLKNPSVIADLEVRPALASRLEELSKNFDANSLEPLSCFEVADRAEGNVWIELRHTGANEGRGTVDWSAIAAARFKGRDPALQAFDFVLQHGKLTDEQRSIIQQRFPISTLDRILSTPDARSRIGFDVKGGKLLTSLPPEEAIKPLKRIVLDLAEKKINVTALKLKDQQVRYVSQLGPTDSPDMSKTGGSARAVDSLTEFDFPHPPPPPKKTNKSKPGLPKTAVHSGSRLNVTNPKINEIFYELKTLRLADYPHAISVLLRVFLETSVDDYLARSGIPTTKPKPSGGKINKTLKEKTEEAIDHMVANGAVRKDFEGVTKGFGDRNHPFSIELMHSYVHNRFFSPTRADLAVAWNNAEPFFKRIWP
jgi:hypothetical protein